jgi:hypothetical protein
MFSSQFRKIEFPPPNEEARLDILKIHSRKMNLTRSVKTIFIFLLEVGRFAPVAIPALSRFGSRHLSKNPKMGDIHKGMLKYLPTKNKYITRYFSFHIGNGNFFFNVFFLGTGLGVKSPPGSYLYFTVSILFN